MMENMIIYEDDVRVAYPLFQREGGGSIPTSALDFSVQKISINLARHLNALWHSRLPKFSTGFCLTATVCYGAMYDGLWYAAAIWTPPVARLLPAKKWLELRRFAIAPNAPRFTASRMLSVMAKMIHRDFEQITVLISYQDIKAHKGTIYKAAGWQISKEHDGGSWDRPNSVNTYNRKPRTRPDSNAATGPKIRWEKRI